jgi:ABC-type multidrug transport system fused ATPase/permease subunit
VWHRSTRNSHDASCWYTAPDLKIPRDTQALLLHLNGVARLNALRLLVNATCTVGIVGPVKAGKSTLRNILAGLPHRGAPPIMPHKYVP